MLLRLEQIWVSVNGLSYRAVKRMDFQFSEQNELPQIILAQVKHFSNLKWIFNIFPILIFVSLKSLYEKLNNAFGNIEIKCFRIAWVLDLIFLTSAAWWMRSKLADRYGRPDCFSEWINYKLRSFSMLYSWQKFIWVTATFSFFQFKSRSERWGFSCSLTAHRHHFRWSKSA